MRRWNILSPRHRARSLGATLATLALALSLGCVTAGRHQETVGERDALASANRALGVRVEQLEAVNAGLDSDRVRLLDELEDYTLDRERLSGDVERQRIRLGKLRQSLTARETELADSKSKLDARTEEVQRLRGTYDSLVSDLEAEVADGQIEIEQLREGIRLNVSDEILFPSGSAELNAQGLEVLGRVANQLTKNRYEIQVQGHTDNRSIRGTLAKRFPTNWELAGARATRVVRLFDESGVDGERMSAVSRGQFAPIADNATSEGRASNRRIEIRLLPTTPLPGESGDAAEADDVPSADDSGPAEGAASNPS